MKKRLWMICVICLLSVTFSQASPADQVLVSSGVKGGLIVHVGCGNGSFTAQLGRERFLVHGLDRNPDNVARARKAVDQAGVADRVWIDHLPGNRLPYADDLVNLLILEAPGVIPTSEVMRVLVPGGTAMLRNGATWKNVLKSRPKEIDEWTHHLHDASCNAVAEDSIVGPPRRMKWAEKPLWSNHHNTVANVDAMVSANGRLFYICEESLPSIDPRVMPDRWNLVGRDAFNGILLWRIPIADWGWKAWSTRPMGRNNQPTHIGRRLVAVENRVYVTLGYNAPVTELDAATGKALRVFKGTENTDAILCHDGCLILSINKGPQGPDPKKRKAPTPAVRKAVAVIDIKTGRTLWRKGDYEGLRSKTGSMDRINHLTMAAGGDQVFFLANQKELVSLDIKTGNQKWRVERPAVKEHRMRYNVRVTDRCTLVYHDGIVFFSQPDPIGRYSAKKAQSHIYAFATDTGAKLWERTIAGWGWSEPPDVFIINSQLWVHDLKTFSLLALDPRTGKEQRRFSTQKALKRGHHHRCYRNRATENYILTSHRGIEFFDLKTGENALNPFVRGACQFGYIPCNGMVYSTPHPCVCFIESQLNGILALAPERHGSKPSIHDSGKKDRLVRGPAYGRLKPGAGKPDDGNWPTYRHDPARSGSTGTEVPGELKPIWTAHVQGKPTACVIGGGKVLVASTSTHRVHAFDEKTGAPVWTTTLGGPMDSPPTIHEGAALCGGLDGWVYCLRLSDGELAWRFRAAPEERRIVTYGRLESAWPVHGSILVQNGKAYCVAGRSSCLDGGIYAYVLDPKTGDTKKEECIATAGESKKACLADVLVGSGASIYMRRRALFGPRVKGAAFVQSQTGLLGEAWFYRAPWYFGGARAQYLIHDSETLYGVVACGASYDKDIFKPGGKGYEVYAAQVDLAKKTPRLRGVYGTGKKTPRLWSVNVPVRIVAMVNSPRLLFAAGSPDVVDAGDPWAALQGRKGGCMFVMSKGDGRIQSKYGLKAPPVLDGMAAAHGKLFMSLRNGQLICMGKE